MQFHKYKINEGVTITFNRRNTIKDLIADYMTSDASPEQIYTEFQQELQEYVRFHNKYSEKATKLHAYFSGGKIPKGNRL